MQQPQCTQHIRNWELESFEILLQKKNTNWYFLLLRVFFLSYFHTDINIAHLTITQYSEQDKVITTTTTAAAITTTTGSSSSIMMWKEKQ